MWFWLRVSHEAAVKLSAGLQTLESFTRARGSSAKMVFTHVAVGRMPYFSLRTEGLSSLPHGLFTGLLSVLPTWKAASPRVSELRKRAERKLQYL